MSSASKISAFTDLIVWQESHKLVLAIYQVTKKFPREEMFGLVSQMRRSAVSITSNLCEGFARKTAKEKIQFYYIAIGSLSELKNQLIISKDLRYLDYEVFEKLSFHTVSVHKLFNAFVKSAKNKDVNVSKY
ncbi:MAG: four helix bundle protein [bacterium]|nr:four helix bundle protein [bacterium]